MGKSGKTALHAKIHLSANGRIVIPADIRQAMGIKPGDALLMDVEDGVMQVESFPVRIRRIQESLRKYIPDDRILSDELIAERREEARRALEEGLG